MFVYEKFVIFLLNLRFLLKYLFYFAYVNLQAKKLETQEYSLYTNKLINNKQLNFLVKILTDYNLLINTRVINKRTNLGNMYFENAYIITTSNIKANVT